MQSLNYNLLMGNMPGLMLFQMDRADTPLMREALYKMGLNEHEVARVAGFACPRWAVLGLVKHHALLCTTTDPLP